MGRILTNLIEELTTIQLSVDVLKTKQAMRLQECEERYEGMVARYKEKEPHWEQGYTSDSVAAQGLVNNLIGIQEALGLRRTHPEYWDVQAEVLVRLDELLTIEQKYNEFVYKTAQDKEIANDCP